MSCVAWPNQTRIGTASNFLQCKWVSCSKSYWQSYDLGWYKGPLFSATKSMAGAMCINVVDSSQEVCCPIRPAITSWNKTFSPLRAEFCRCSVCAVCCVCSVLRRLAVCAVLRDDYNTIYGTITTVAWDRVSLPILPNDTIYGMVQYKSTYDLLAASIKPRCWRVRKNNLAHPFAASCVTQRYQCTQINGEKCRRGRRSNLLLSFICSRS